MNSSMMNLALFAIVAFAVVANASVTRSNNGNTELHSNEDLDQFTEKVDGESQDADADVKLVETNSRQGYDDPDCFKSKECCDEQEVYCQPGPFKTCGRQTEWVWRHGCVRATPAPSTPAPTLSPVDIISMKPQEKAAQENRKFSGTIDLGCWKDGLSLIGYGRRRSLLGTTNGGISCKNANKDGKCTVQQCADIVLKYAQQTGYFNNIFAIDENSGRCFTSNGKDNYRQHGKADCKQKFMVVNHVYQLGGITDLGLWAATRADGKGAALQGAHAPEFVHGGNRISYGIHCKARNAMGRDVAMPCSKVDCLNMALSASASTAAKVSSKSNSAPTLFGLDTVGKCYWSQNGADVRDYKQYGAVVASAATGKLIIPKTGAVHVFRTVPQE